MKYRTTHTTRYVYGETVPLCHNVVRLQPREDALQACFRHTLHISPAPPAVDRGRDYFGNHVAWFSLQEPHAELTITAISEVDVQPQPPMGDSLPWEEVARQLAGAVDRPGIAARQFCFDSPHINRSDELAEYARPSFSPGRPLLQATLDLARRIHDEFAFVPGVTTIGTPLSDVLRARQGVCQDFAHLQIGCLRSLGLAARYVSGYLLTHPPPGHRRLTGADVSHAWLSIFHPPDRWIDFDPTNGMMPEGHHVTLGWARDYEDVGPVKGIIVGGQRHWLRVAVDVTPIPS